MDKRGNDSINNKQCDKKWENNFFNSNKYFNL